MKRSSAASKPTQPGHVVGDQEQLGRTPSETNGTHNDGDEGHHSGPGARDAPMRPDGATFRQLVELIERIGRLGHGLTLPCGGHFQLSGFTGRLAGIAHSSEPFDEHGIARKSRLVVEERIEYLVVLRHTESKLDPNRSLFRASVTPPITFKIQDSGFAIGQGKHGLGFRVDSQRLI
jgi:hypothetical protein